MKPGGEFVGGDPGGEFAVVAPRAEVAGIHGGEKLAACRLASDECGVVLGREEIGDRRPAFGRLDHGALVDRRQEARAPVHRSARRQAAVVGKHDKRGQLLRFAAEAVGDPRPHRRESGKDEAAVGHEHRRTVERGLALHRMDERHLIDVAGELRQQVADPAAALAVLPEGPIALLAVPRLRGEELHVAGRVERRAIPLHELGLVVKRVEVREAAGAEDVDHRLRLGRKHRWLRGQRIGREGRRSCLFGEERREGHATEAAAQFPKKFPEKGSPRHVAAVQPAGKCVWRHRCQST